jgi:cell division protein ZapE
MGVIIVMTSNYPPDKLYPNGLHRESFLPTIALLNQNLDVFEVDSGIDYRLRALEQVEIYHHPADASAEKKMLDYFQMVAGEEGKKGGHIEMLGRNIDTVRRGHGVIWFDFRTLCGGPRSQNDYLEISRGYHTVLLSHIPEDDHAPGLGSPSLHLAGRRLLRPQGEADRHCRLRGRSPLY